MKSHRLIWSIALVAALAALGAMAYRSSQIRLHDRQVARMLKLLEHDPQARLEKTRAAVNAVVQWAQGNQRQTPETYFALGLRLYGENRLPEAEKALRNVVALRPNWALAQNGLGIILFAEGKTKEAEDAFRKAMKLDPAWSRPHNDMAILLRVTGHLQEAETEALTAIKLDPNSVDVHNNYGNLLVKMKRYDEAAKQYSIAMELNPDHPWPHYNLACLYAQMGRKEEALGLLALAIKHYPPFREEARTDSDLDPIRDDPRFKALVAEPPNSSE